MSDSKLTNDFVNAMLEDAEIEREMQSLQVDTAHCASPLAIYEEASAGWNPDWQKMEHPENCSHCRRGARVAFLNNDPGFWILQDRHDQGRPSWWRIAIADYLENGPALVRHIARAKHLWEEAARITLSMGSTSALSVSPIRAMGLAEAREDREVSMDRIGSSWNETGDMQVLLWELSRGGGRDGRHGTVEKYILEVRDLETTSGSKTVEVGLSGRRNWIRQLRLEPKEGGLGGEIEISPAEMRQIRNSAEDQTVSLLGPILVN